MATKKTTFKGKTAEELAKLLVEKREALRAFRFAATASRPKDVTEGRKIRQDIARILTEQTAQEAAANA